MQARCWVALALLAGARVAAGVDVSECGQAVAADQVGDLRNDLACTAGPTWPFSASGVRLEPGAKLRMNGFDISGDGTGVGVLCTSGRCTVEGPGAVRRFWAGINCGGCRVVARDVAVRENVEGIHVPLSGTLEARRVVASDNLQSGIWAQTVRATDVDASGNGVHGVSAIRRLRARRLRAGGNGGPGVVGGHARNRLADSVVTDNDAAGDGFDVVSTGNVRLVLTICGRSARIRYLSQEEYEVTGSFGCAGD